MSTPELNELPGRERSSDGALIVREGLPARWHYKIVVRDETVKGAKTVRGSIEGMFDGLLRCNLLLSNLSEEEETAVDQSRSKVLSWIAEYHARNGPADPPTAH